jgi:glucokinase
MSMLAADIGGTRMRIAWCDPVSAAHEEALIESTPADFDSGMKLVRSLLVKAAAGRRAEQIVMGIPGVIDSSTGTIIRSPHLKGWNDKSIANALSDIAPITIVNDAALVGLGEAVYGAGKGADIVAYVTVSTGIGGARIVRGRIDPTFEGFEPGFQIVDYKTGETLEHVASGSAVERRFGKHPKEVAKTDAWKEVERALAVGIHNVILHWSPEVVVIGGSMSNDLSASRMAAELNRLMRIHPKLPQVRIASLGALGGLFGAMAMGKGVAGV